MNNIVSDDIARMVHLYSYKSNTSSSDKPSSVVEYHEVGADGKTYGILKEGTKYYIKVAPAKETKILAEDYDYIGGITNKKRYEYNSYSNAYKQFDLKMMSINEAFNNVYDDVESKTKPEQTEWQIKETKEMRAELDRYNKIVENVDKILTEGTNAKRPKVGTGAEIGSATGSKANNGNPFNKTAKKEMNQKTGNCKNAKCADDTFDETPMTQEKINKMGENENFNGSDKTYNKKAKVDKSKMNEQTALCSRENPDYMDMSHGTHKGSSAPYCDGKQCSCEDDNLCDEECVDNDDQNNPKPGTGCAKCKSDPWKTKVNEETILPDEAAGFDSEEDDDLTKDLNDETPFGTEDDDFSNEEVESDEFSEDYVEDESGDIDSEDDELDDDEDFSEEDEELDDDDEFSEEDDELDDDDVFSEEDEEVDDDEDFSEEDDELDDDEDFSEEDDESGENPMDDECINEGVIDYWGKHPAYLKSPFSLPDDTEIDRWGKDWNDDSAKGGKYGKSKGKSSPYEYDEDLLVDNIVKIFLKKKR